MTIHRFEAAGLGRAPFRIVGVTEKRGPIVISETNGVTMTCGAPGQPMGVCDYCGQSIVECWAIRSADGKNFVVGCDCVAKTDDAGLIRRVKAEHKAAAKVKRDAKAAAVSAELGAALANGATRAVLSALPHPRGFDGKSALDYAEWMIARAGAKGRAEVAKMIRAIA